MRSVLERGAVAMALLAAPACDEGQGDPPEETSSTGEHAETSSGGESPGTSGDSSGDQTAGTGEVADTTGTDTTEGSAIPGRACPPDSFVTADNFGMPLMLGHCNGCHNSGLAEDMRQGAPLGVDFDTVEDVRTHAERIYARAADDSTSMPPAAGPSEEERRWLGDWLACGAP